MYKYGINENGQNVNAIIHDRHDSVVYKGIVQSSDLSAGVLLRSSSIMNGPWSGRKSMPVDKLDRFRTGLSARKGVLQRWGGTRLEHQAMASFTRNNYH